MQPCPGVIVPDPVGTVAEVVVVVVLPDAVVECARGIRGCKPELAEGGGTYVQPRSIALR